MERGKLRRNKRKGKRKASKVDLIERSLGTFVFLVMKAKEEESFVLTKIPGTTLVCRNP